MLTIHGIWAHGVLSLWAEDSGQPAVGRDTPGRPARAPRPHPFAASTGLLADVLSEVGEAASDLVRKAAEDELTIWLPGTSAGPLASPDLARTADQAAAPVSGAHSAGEAASRGATAASLVRTGRITLAPWQVPALSFDPAAALALLGAISQPDARSERGIPAGTVYFLAALAALAADLTARGRVLPGVAAADDGTYSAGWRPVLAGADALRARELTIALPPLCRATSADGEASAAVVTEALDLLTDAAVRARLSRVPGFALLPAGPAAPTR